MWLNVSALKTQDLERMGEVIGFNPTWVHPDFNPEGTCLCFNTDGDWTVAQWCNDHDEWHTKNSNPELNGEMYKPIGAPTQIRPKPSNPLTWLSTFESYRDKAHTMAVQKNVTPGSKGWLTELIKMLPGMELHGVIELPENIAFATITIAANVDMNIATEMLQYIFHFTLPIFIDLRICFRRADHIAELEGIKEIPNTKHTSCCLLKARDNEPIFVLLGRDETAADTIDCWINNNVGRQPEEKLNEAAELGDQMREYHIQTSGIDQL